MAHCTQAKTTQHGHAPVDATRAGLQQLKFQRNFLLQASSQQTKGNLFLPAPSENNEKKFKMSKKERKKKTKRLLLPKTFRQNCYPVNEPPQPPNILQSVGCLCRYALQCTVIRARDTWEWVVSWQYKTNNNRLSSFPLATPIYSGGRESCNYPRPRHENLSSYSWPSTLGIRPYM